MVGLWIGNLFAAALPLLLLVSLHVCLAGLCLLSCGAGSALGCHCSAAAKKSWSQKYMQWTQRMSLMPIQVNIVNTLCYLGSMLVYLRNAAVSINHCAFLQQYPMLVTHCILCRNLVLRKRSCMIKRRLSAFLKESCTSSERNTACLQECSTKGSCFFTKISKLTWSNSLCTWLNVVVSFIMAEGHHR